MYIPVLKKVIYSDNILLERALPLKGTISAHSGQKVEPFHKLGIAKVSYSYLELGPKIKLVKGKDVGSFVYSGKKIGSVGLHSVIAPFDGYIAKRHDSYVLRQENRDYWLLAGVWGEVVDVIKDTSILIKTQAVDIHLTVSTNKNIEGELIVFPNPSDLLEMQYLENFTKNVEGKIIYVGDFATYKFMKRAYELGVAGVLAGGADKNTFVFAKENGMFLGVFTGFGYEHIPGFIYDILKDVSSRYVFMYGDKGILRIPMPAQSSGQNLSTKNTSPFRLVEKGLKVQVLQKPYFGWIGEVDSISGSSIFVRFDGKKDIQEVKIPNILAIE